MAFFLTLQELFSKCRARDGRFRVEYFSIFVINSNDVVIAVPPEVTIDGDQKQFVPVGNEILLTCRYNASPPASEVQWIKDGIVIARNNASVVINDSRVTIPLHNENQVQLSIINTTASEDAGNYTCLVINAVGNFSDTTSIVIQVVPDPPFNVTVDSKSSRVVNISWMAGFDGNSAILDYTVKISVDNLDFIDIACQGSLSNSACVLSNSITSASLKYLFPWTTYNIRVFARNLIGTSTGSSVVSATTDEEVPSAAPTFNVTVVNSTAVIVSWQMLSKDQARGAVLGYNISYKTELGYDVWVNRTVDGGDTTSYMVTSLKKFTSYKFVMQAFNSKGASPPSGAVGKKTDQDMVPDPPFNVTVDAKGSRVVNISWMAGFDGNSAILNYTVKISEDNQNFRNTVCQGSLSNSACVLSNSFTSASLKNLLPWTTYYIQVFARNIIGTSTGSSVVNTTTDEEVPSVPPTFSVIVLNSTAVNVSWQTKPEEAVLGYNIFYKTELGNDVWVNRTVDGGDTTSYMVTSLKKFTSYKFVMQAFNSKGASPPSGAVVKKTDQDSID
ncbi:hypothetical protein OS493_008536 [Desmophyllum pertusum]|uniref:Uncharacterized protein n=1 Tax=Desmophyllum pertusum TaxID=174260 RepID=A0A9X0D3Y3_9CNID|nr:hypothetical protein OS493_008536 [Desmophyllum pertusum]